jgi:acylaminoacyl-peptidase
MGMGRRLTAADVFGFRSVAAPQIAADGSRIVAIVTRRDITTDTRIPTLEQTRDRVTWTEVPDTAGVLVARLSPDGTRIALIRRTPAGYELAVHADAAPPIVLHRTSTAMRELAFSPDGRSLAFQARVDAPLPDWLGLPVAPEGAKWAQPPRHTDRLLYRHDAMGELPESVFHIFVIDVDGGAPARQLTSGVWHNGLAHHVPPGLIWVADGASVLISGTRRADWDRKPGETDLHAVAITDGAVRQLTDIPGQTAHPAPSPDGTLIAFTAVHDRGLSHHLRRLFVMAAHGGEPREVLPGFDRSIDDIAWDADGRSLIVTYDDPGAGHIARVRLEDGALTVLARDASAGAIEMPYAGHGFSAAQDGSLVYVRSAVDVPSEVGLIEAGATSPHSLTALNAGLATEVGGFRLAETFWVTGGDGRQVQCWLLLPPGDGPHPAVLEIHGGPYAQYGARFSIKHQAMAAAGYAVLYCNPAGSTGYGEAFTDALHDRFPGPDWDDLMAAVDVVAARPDIDADHLFVSGQSGGGVLTLWTVIHSHRFRGAVAIKPVVDWSSWVLGSDIGASVGLRWMGDALPWEAPEKYRARSPVTYAAQVRTPTLLMAGEADTRTPMSETLQMYAALRLAGVDAHLMRFPGASHSSSAMRPSLFAAEIAATIGWFDRQRTRLL